LALSLIWGAFGEPTKNDVLYLNKTLIGTDLQVSPLILPPGTKLDGILDRNSNNYTF